MGRALGWLLGLFGVFCVIIWGASHAFLKEIPVALNVVGGVGALSIGLWIFLDWGSLSQLGKDQTVERSATAGFASLLVFGIAVVANVLGHRYDDYVDVTTDKRFTLSQQSKDIVAKLSSEVQILAFFQRGSAEEVNFKALMDTYEPHTTLLKVEYHDPFSEPRLAEEMKILTTAGAVIVKVGENQQRIESKFDEEAFTNALVRVSSSTTHKVCVVTGHGELEKDDTMSPSGLGFAITKLEGMNYAASTVNLTEQAPTPDTCKILLLASPRTDLFPTELDRIAAYVAAGGGFIAMLDPLQAQATAADMSRYGITVGGDVLIENDPNRQVAAGDPTFVLLDSTSWDPHPLTEKLRGMSILRLARSVSKGADIAGINVQELAHSSIDSWAETNLADPNVPAAPDEGVDKVGNVPVIVAAEVTDPASLRTKTEGAITPAAPSPVAVEAAAPAPELPKKAGGKVVVFGDADFANNTMIANGVNLDLVLNTVAWMADEKDQISIRPNEAAKNKLTLDVLSLFIAGVTSVLIVPGLTIAGAVGTWLQRRRR